MCKVGLSIKIDNLDAQGIQLFRHKLTHLFQQGQASSFSKEVVKGLIDGIVPENAADRQRLRGEIGHIGKAGEPVGAGVGNLVLHKSASK